MTIPSIVGSSTGGAASSTVMPFAGVIDAEPDGLDGVDSSGQRNQTVPQMANRTAPRERDLELMKGRGEEGGAARIMRVHLSTVRITNDEKAKNKL